LRGTGPLLPQHRSFDEEPTPPIGWPIWLTWVFGLLGFFLAAVAWVFMGLAALTPLTIDQTLLLMVLLGPVIGGAVSLPGVIFALLAARRARKVGAGVAAPVTLVCLTTAVLIGGLLFGGFVSYPRERLGTFGQAIQAHCARFAQSLQAYGTPPDINKLKNDPVGVITILRNDQAALKDDQAALNALTAPDAKYQPLLDDCRNLAAEDSQVTSTLLSELTALPPDLTAAQKTLTQYQSDTSAMLAEIQTLGAELKQQVFAPFQPG
jgi:hypothetical protein